MDSQLHEARRTGEQAEVARTAALAQVHQADQAVAARELLGALETMVESQVAPVVDEARAEIRAELEAEAGRISDRATGQQEAVAAGLRSHLEKLTKQLNEAGSESSAALGAIKAEAERAREAADRARGEAGAKLEELAEELDRKSADRRSKLEKAVGERIEDRLAERIEKRVVARVEREVEQVMAEQRSVITKQLQGLADNLRNEMSALIAAADEREPSAGSGWRSRHS